jgi:type II secretory pathway predicted ATPase ExeA/cell division septation protein DedD
MYLDHFGLRTDPFPLYPSLKFVFMSSPFEETMAHLAYGLEYEEDIILISGPIGTGKTLAVQSLLANLSKLYRTAFVNVTQLDFGELLKLVLADLGAPASGAVDRGDLLVSLKEQVRLAQARGHKILIVVDEAQNLALETLEGLRMLTNLGQPEGQALQLVLVGQPDIERKIALPQLAQLRQRIRVHYRLETLDRKELEAYIAFRLKVAGVEKSFFKPRAIDLIHRASSGVPRLVNILCSRAMLSAFVAGRHEVEVEHIDLDDLPLAVGLASTAADARPAARPPVSRAVSPAATPAVNPAPSPAPSPAASPAVDPVASPVAEAPAVARTEVPAAGGAAARPFEPMVSYRRRNQRSAVYFLVTLLLLGIAAVVVFSLKPTRKATVSLPRPAGARDTVAEKAPAMIPAAGPDATPAIVAEAPPAPAGSPETDRTGAGESPAVVKPAVAAPAIVKPAVAAPAVVARAAAPGDSLSVPPELTATLGTPAGWAVHVHSFHDADRPEDDIARFRSAGFPSFYRSAQVDGQTWQRVYLGPYSSLAEAQAVAARVRAEGLSSYAQVVKIANGDQ